MPVPLPVVPTPDSGDYPPLSALNDLLFCQRRCYLHRVENVWIDNVHTTAGTLDHRRVHQARDADEADSRTARGLPLVSHRLRLSGVADLVEFRPDPTGGAHVPYPVEYKRGRRRKWDNDDVQLCAQALCLEEMLGVHIPAGAIYHIGSRRRREVRLTADLRRETEAAAERLHALLRVQTAPPPVLHPRCRQCSVQRLCLPELLTAPAAYHRAADSLFCVPSP